jgi:L,D-peptidoglycan transpeptidase YkuD (ErfK/YbiS/YcfS/YnhG family)
MKHHAIASTLIAMLLLGLAARATAQGFLSVSSLPATPAASITSPAAPSAPAEPAFASASSQQPQSTSAAVPAAAATLAFSSVSSLGAGSNATGAGPSLPSRTSLMADRILVDKGKRRLYLMHRGQVIAEYPVKLGLSPRGHKQFEGDFRTPEGVYHLSRRNPRSEFFLSVEVSYPNETDRARAKAEGLSPGGLIMIHGQPNVPRRPPEYYASNDWTDGCIAVSNSAMVDIWQRTRLGIPIEIRP